MQGQPLLRAEALHAVKRLVHMVGQALGSCRAGVTGALGPALAIATCPQHPERLAEHRFHLTSVTGYSARS